MESKTRTIPLAKSGRREVSHFVGQELLYDYLMNNLDSLRAGAMKDHVKFSREAQNDLEKMQFGLQYVEQLSRTTVSSSIISEISEPTTYVSELFKKTRFEKWPIGVKWGLEALLIVGVIVSVLVVVPWDKTMNLFAGKSSEEIILAEVSKNGSGTDTEVAKSDEQAQFQDEGLPANATASSANTATAKNDSVPTQATADVEVKREANVKVEPVKIETPTVAKSTGTLPKGVPAAESGGFLFRGDLIITNVDASTPKLVSKIEEIGGRKAGDVALGWKKSSSSSYFHFTVPAAKYPELMNFMAGFGKVKISKEKHPRVMPEGIIRLIVTAEEAKK